MYSRSSRVSLTLRTTQFPERIRRALPLVRRLRLRHFSPADTEEELIMTLLHTAILKCKKGVTGNQGLINLPEVTILINPAAPLNSCNLLRQLFFLWTPPSIRRKNGLFHNSRHHHDSYP